MCAKSSMIRKRNWGIQTNTTMLPGFSSKKEAMRYIKDHTDLGKASPVRLADKLTPRIKEVDVS